MAEYIEKQAALDIVNGWRDQLIPTYGKNDEYVLCLETVAERLESLHTADVRPVVRGKWEVVDLVEYDGHGECVRYPKEGICCTNCKNAFEKKLLWKDNYCPNCGADMRETEE